MCRSQWLETLQKLDTLPRITFYELFLFSFLTPSDDVLPSTLYVSVSQFKTAFSAFIEAVSTFDKLYHLALLSDAVAFTKARAGFLPMLACIWDAAVSEPTTLTVLWLCLMVLYLTTLLNAFHFLSNLGFFNTGYKTLILLLHPMREKKHHLL